MSNLTNLRQMFTFMVISGVTRGQAEVVQEVSSLVHRPGGSASYAVAVLVL